MAYYLSWKRIKTGRPSFPYLFILAAEGLSILLNKATEENSISGLMFTRRSPKLSHLLFVDDTMILTKADDGEAYEVLSILNLYSWISGQRINSAKSSIIFGGVVQHRLKETIGDILSMPQGSRASRYLGLPGEWQRSKTQTLNWLKDRVWQKIQGWKEKFLSTTGKEVLIKAVVQAIPSYVMSIFMLPKTFCAKLAAMTARFWWRQAGRDKGIH